MKQCPNVYNHFRIYSLSVLYNELGAMRLISLQASSLRIIMKEFMYLSSSFMVVLSVSSELVCTKRVGMGVAGLSSGSKYVSPLYIPRAGASVTLQCAVLGNTKEGRTLAPANIQYRQIITLVVKNTCSLNEGW